MGNNKTKGIVVLIVLLAVISVVGFALPFPKNEVFIIAYAFGILAILIQIYVFRVAFKGTETVKSKFYGFPIARIGMVYLIVQLVVSVAEFILAVFIPFWIPLIANVVIFAIAIIGCVAAETMREEIERQDVELKKGVKTMRAQQSFAASLPGLTDDAEMKNALQKVADSFKYSDPMTNDETEALEENLMQQLDEIQRAVLDGDAEAVKKMGVKICADLEERNRICRLNKR